MLSKGKKIMYLCPKCGSDNIKRVHHTSLIAKGQKTGECMECNTYWPWSSRTKAPINIKTLK